MLMHKKLLNNAYPYHEIFYSIKKIRILCSIRKSLKNEIDSHADIES